MKPGARALGVAESFQSDVSTLAGVVVRASRVVDGFVFGRASVGGTDATDAVIDLVFRLERPDVQFILLSGIAPAWYNILDLYAIHEAVDRPVISVTYEESSGLEESLNAEFSGEARDTRLDICRRQPDRDRLLVNDETLFVRAVGLEEAEAHDVVRAFTPEGGRPEPLRVARLAARAVDQMGADS
ncbi:MAG: DUF99 family protein [Halobacteriales archaeon]|nr:DUF99 family protein [Halobacteriales archaeon]